MGLEGYPKGILLFYKFPCPKMKVVRYLLFEICAFENTGLFVYLQKAPLTIFRTCGTLSHYLSSSVLKKINSNSMQSNCTIRPGLVLQSSIFIKTFCMEQIQQKDLCVGL